MAKSLIPDRIAFKKFSEQHKFILEAKLILGFSWQELAKIVDINERTLKDWSRKNLRMSYQAAITISQKSKLKLPKNTWRINWQKYLESISKKGGKENFRKNKIIGGDAKKRQEKWQEWWNKTGQYRKNKILSKSEIKIPKFNNELAEFVGIMMGDGGVAPYHISITLNSETDKIYVKFIEKLIKKLFGTKPKKYKKNNSKAIDIIVQRKALVEFCQKIGLRIGNKLKQGLDFPDWILKNPNFTKSCIRGLFDTDGSIFIHKYKIKNKIYFYPKISFTSASKNLIKSMSRALIKLGFNVRISKSSKDIIIEDQKHVKKYLKTIGSHNQKYWIKYNHWKVAGAVNGTVC